MRLAIVISALLLLAGCDHVNQQQYRVTEVPSNSADAARLTLVVGSVAKEVGLEERTSTSKVPDTLAYYVQPDTAHFAVHLGARLHEGDALVDLSAGIGPVPKKYKDTSRLLRTALHREFGSRVTTPQPMVPIESATKTGDQDRSAGEGGSR